MRGLFVFLPFQEKEFLSCLYDSGSKFGVGSFKVSIGSPKILHLQTEFAEAFLDSAGPGPARSPFSAAMGASIYEVPIEEGRCQHDEVVRIG